MPTASRFTRADRDDGRLLQTVPDDLAGAAACNPPPRRSARPAPMAPLRQGGILHELYESMGQLR